MRRREQALALREADQDHTGTTPKEPDPRAKETNVCLAWLRAKAEAAGLDTLACDACLIQLGATRNQLHMLLYR